MQDTQLLLLNLAIVMGLQVVVWLISLRLNNAAIADVFWGFGFVVLAWLSYWTAGSASGRSVLLVALTSLWGLRLSGYLAWRNLGKDEDHRYGAMREPRSGHFWIWSLPFVFLLQGFLIWLVAVPVQLAVSRTAPLNWLDGVGALLWCGGWLCETIGDWQLARFKSEPENRGKVLDRGLWRYTRHPNYFGDFVLWWGLFLIAAAAGGLWWTVFSPVVMSILLVRVSGVHLLERTITERRPEYASYIRRTSAFVPWPPRRKAALEKAHNHQAHDGNET